MPLFAFLLFWVTMVDVFDYNNILGDKAGTILKHYPSMVWEPNMAPLEPSHRINLVTKSTEKSTQDLVNVVGANTKEVYWLPVASINTSTTRRQVL
jgi:hypothetical protein